jgi:hypothetical protein
MSFPWRHTDSSDDYEEFTLESTHLFRWLFVDYTVMEGTEPWEDIALGLLNDPREYLDKTRKIWDDYNRERGDTFGNYVGLELVNINPLRVSIFCTAYYANGFPCSFNVTYEQGVMTDILVGH